MASTPDESSNLGRDNDARFAAYNIPGTSVLRNKLGITDAATLREAEYLFTTERHKNLPRAEFSVQGLKAVHHHLFQDLYDWAGEFRTANMTLGGRVSFADWWTLEASAEKLFAAVAKEATDHPPKSIEEIGERAARLTGALNRMHPFREGNGRTMRSYLTSFAGQQGFVVDFEYMPKEKWLAASTDAYHQKYETMQALVVSEHPVSLQRAAEAAAAIRQHRFDHLRGSPDGPEQRPKPDTGPSLSD